MKGKTFAVAPVQTYFGEFFIAVIGDAEKLGFRRRDLCIVGAHLRAQPDVAVERLAKLIDRKRQRVAGNCLFEIFFDFFDFQLDL